MLRLLWLFSLRGTEINLMGWGGLFLKKNEKVVCGEQPGVSTPGQFTGLQFKDRIQQGVDYDYLADVVWDIIEPEYSGTAVRDMSLQLAEGGRQ